MVRGSVPPIYKEWKPPPPLINIKKLNKKKFKKKIILFNNFNIWPFQISEYQQYQEASAEDEGEFAEGDQSAQLE